MPPPTLSYARPDARDAPAAPWRTLVAWLVAGAGLCLLATLWLRLGIAYGQRVEGQEMLAPFATGTTFWDTWVMDVPVGSLFVGLAALGVFVLVRVARREWPTMALCLPPAYAAMFLVTLVANVPLLDRVSP